MKVRTAVLKGKLDVGAFGFAGARTLDKTLCEPKGITLVYNKESGLSITKGSVTIEVPLNSIDYVITEA